MSKKKQKTIEELLEETLVPEYEQPYELPKNWVWVFFEKAVETIGNGRKQIPQKKYEKQGLLPIVDQGQKLISGYTDNVELQFSGELPVIVFGDHTKCIKWVDFKFVQGADGTKLLSPKNNFYPKYLYYLLQAVNLPDKGYSRHFKYLREIPLPCPPINEQKRIVEKIDHLFTKIDEAKQLIEEAKASFLSRRAAIFNKAFRGELTQKWRESNAYVEPIGDFMDKVSNSFNPKLKYTPLEKEPYILPLGWGWVRLGNITSMQNGLSKRRGETGSFHPVLRLADINGNEFLDTDLRQIKLTEKELSKYKVVDDDILFVRVNGSREIVGKAVKYNLPVVSAFCDHLIKADIYPEIHHDYILYAFESLLIKEQIQDKIVSSAGQNTISQESLANLLIPLPPKAEADEIVKLLNEFSSIENNLDKTLFIEGQIENIKKSILSKAFRGELGTNILSEEHAVELLKEVLISR